MTTIESIVDIAPGETVPTTDDSGWLVVEIESLLIIRTIGSGKTLGKAMYNAYHQLVRSRGQAEIRIVRVADKPAYNQIAADNYKAAWSGNPRSGEYDNTRDWSDARSFPWANREAGYVPVTPWGPRV